jgi:peptide/nickel transport system permease protein
LLRYFRQRLLRIIPILLVGTFFTFSLTSLLPGDPTVALLGTSATEANVKDLRHRLELDKPLPYRYVKWLGRAATGDLGRLYANNRTVSSRVKESITPSLELMLYAQLIALGLAIPIGVYAGYRRERFFDKFTTTSSSAMIAIPPFVLGLYLVYFFALHLHWFKPTGYVPITENFGDHVKSMVLPSVTLAAGLFATYVRLLRSDMVATLQEDFITMARAKGMSPTYILFRHALKPSLFSLVTSAGLNIGALIGGTVIVEGIFAIPGFGSFIIGSVLAREYLAVQACFLIVVVFFIAVNLFVEFLYGVLDPRVRHARALA